MEPLPQNSLLRNWPLYAALALLLVLVWLTVGVAMARNRGVLVYALDDAYIHMAMAKNFSRFGVWGVTRYGFTPTSSSLLWTLLLSLTYWLGGVNQLAPLLWNLAFAILLLVAAHAILRRYKSPAVVRFLALAAMILLVPLPTLVLSGMEQTLQTLLSLLVIFLAARIVSGESPATLRRDQIGLIVLAPLVTAARFEGMFLIATVGALLLSVRRWRYTLAFAACGFLPVLANGMLSVSKGWFWFPTSVLLKATLPNLHSPGLLLLSLADSAFVCMRQSLHVLVLMVAVLVVYIAAAGKGSIARESRQIMGVILVVAAVAHVAFVGAAPLYRYDAYWCALAILFIALQLPVIVPRWPSPLKLSTWTDSRNVACCALALLILFPLAVKGSRLLWFLPRCTNNIFEQQYQMGTFVRQYYQGSTIALNDIGAVDFLADIHCLDLWGLANAQVAAAKRHHTYQVADIRRLAQQNGARIAIIYDNWFLGGVPPEWIRVGRWTIPDNVIAGSETVSFYAPNPTEAVHLAQCLQDFSTHLPTDVIQQGR